MRVQRITEIRRHSSHSPSLTVKEYDAEKDRRHSGVNPNALGLDSERMRFLSCSPAASRRISCGSLFKPNEPIGSSKSSLFNDSSLNFPFDRRSTEKDDKGKDELSSGKDKLEKTKKLPIINPLVLSPHWPSKCPQWHHATKQNNPKKNRNLFFSLFVSQISPLKALDSYRNVYWQMLIRCAQRLAH